MPRYLAFDLETVDPFPEDRNWREVRPLGIGCAAAYASDLRAPIFWCERNERGGVEERMSRASTAGAGANTGPTDSARPSGASMGALHPPYLERTRIRLRHPRGGVRIAG